MPGSGLPAGASVTHSRAGIADSSRPGNRSATASPYLPDTMEASPQLQYVSVEEHDDAGVQDYVMHSPNLLDGAYGADGHPNGKERSAPGGFMEDYVIDGVTGERHAAGDDVAAEQLSMLGLPAGAQKSENNEAIEGAEGKSNEDEAGLAPEHADHAEAIDVTETMTDAAATNDAEAIDGGNGGSDCAEQRGEGNRMARDPDESAHDPADGISCNAADDSDHNGFGSGFGSSDGDGDGKQEDLSSDGGRDVQGGSDGNLRSSQGNPRDGERILHSGEEPQGPEAAIMSGPLPTELSFGDMLRSEAETCVPRRSRTTDTAPPWSASRPAHDAEGEATEEGALQGGLPPPSPADQTDGSQREGSTSGYRQSGYGGKRALQGGQRDRSTSGNRQHGYGGAGALQGGNPSTTPIEGASEDAFEFKLGGRSDRSRGGSISSALQGGCRPSTADRSRCTSETLGGGDGGGTLQNSTDGTLQGGSDAGGAAEGEMDASAPHASPSDDGLGALDESDTLIVVRVPTDLRHHVLKSGFRLQDDLFFLIALTCCINSSSADVFNAFAGQALEFHDRTSPPSKCHCRCLCRQLCLCLYLFYGFGYYRGHCSCPCGRLCSRLSHELFRVYPSLKIAMPLPLPTALSSPLPLPFPWPLILLSPLPLPLPLVLPWMSS